MFGCERWPRCSTGGSGGGAPPASPSPATGLTTSPNPSTPRGVIGGGYEKRAWLMDQKEAKPLKLGWLMEKRAWCMGYGKEHGV